VWTWLRFWKCRYSNRDARAPEVLVDHELHQPFLFWAAQTPTKKGSHQHWCCTYEPSSHIVNSSWARLFHTTPAREKVTARVYQSSFVYDSTGPVTENNEPNTIESNWVAQGKKERKRKKRQPLYLSRESTGHHPPQQ